MVLRSKLAGWIQSERASAAALLSFALFFASDALDQISILRGIHGGEALINHFVIAILGGIALWFFLSLQTERQEMARARERIRITAELNLHVRSALTMMANSALLQDETERLRMMDEAVQQIDRILTEVIPAMALDPQAKHFAKPSS